MTASRFLPAGPTGRFLRRAATPGGLIVIVGLSYALTQLLLFDESRFLEWDEAVYVGKASTRFQPPGWAVHRAIGVPLLIAPSLLISASFLWLRWYLVFASSLALSLGFSAWLGVAGRRAPLAMVLFCTSWLALFYGSEASPNIFVAACAIGATGSLVRHLNSPPRELIPLAAAAAFAVVLRPSDGLVLGVGLALVGMTASSRRQRGIVTSVVGTSMIVGMTPWAVEAWASFDGPAARWREASQLVGGSPRWQVSDHLRLLDGPIVGPDPQTSFPALSIAAAVLYLAVAALPLGSTRLRSTVSVPLALAALMVAPYLVYVGSSAPRFLLPVYGLVAVATSYGLVEIYHWRRIAGAGITVAFVLAGASAMFTADSIERDQGEARSGAAAAAAATRELAGDESCYILSQYAYTQIMIGSGCRGQGLSLDDAACQIAGLAGRDTIAIVSVVGEVPPDLESIRDGHSISGPGAWTTFRIDPSRARCVESPFVLFTDR